uniref:Putative secreted protein n=1 Tax=Anopheles darlingi TaxID=43151 RepID=A0A2M4D4W2_ANODA
MRCAGSLRAIIRSMGGVGASMCTPSCLNHTCRSSVRIAPYCRSPLSPSLWHCSMPSRFQPAIQVCYYG